MPEPIQPVAPQKLLDFPCSFTFKAMLKSQIEKNHAHTIVQQIIQQTVTDIHETSQKHSRTGKYISISINVSLQSEQQLIEIYRNLNAHPQVVMTL